MPYQINIGSFKNNSISQNGSIDIGPTVHNSHTANTKLVGSNFSFGDLSLSTSVMGNGVLDPDVGDQGQVFNPSAPVANQI